MIRGRNPMNRIFWKNGMILWDIIVGSRMSYKANVSYPELSPISRKLPLHFTVERIKFLDMECTPSAMIPTEKEMHRRQQQKDTTKPD